MTLRRLGVTIAVIAAAAALRVWPLQALGSTVAWLTFYPAVMVIAIYGGLWSGLLATFLLCFIVTTLWFVIVAQPFIYSTFQGNYDENGDLISIVGTVLDITAHKRGKYEPRNTLTTRKRIRLYFVSFVVKYVLAERGFKFRSV
ncbi:MAG: hypothetical protein Q8P51_16370 [Ignavibacteria bacterium]|nr:hypothetical protein [Ignavibacteria bacterium]